MNIGVKWIDQEDRISLLYVNVNSNSKEIEVIEDIGYDEYVTGTHGITRTIFAYMSKLKLSEAVFDMYKPRNSIEFKTDDNMCYGFCQTKDIQKYKECFFDMLSEYIETTQKLQMDFIEKSNAEISYTKREHAKLTTFKSKLQQNNNQ